MKKTFTIHSVTRSTISPEKGSISWIVSDESGRERKVSGVTTLDRDGRINSARSVYKREEPLVAELLLRNKGETFTIDFTAFNEANAFMTREAYANMYRHERLASLGQQVWRVLAVLGVVAVLWLGWTLFVSMNELGQPQQTRTHELP
jgi:hypothetical protein